MTCWWKTASHRSIAMIEQSTPMPGFPEPLGEEYLVVSCEKATDRGSAFLAVQRATGQPVLIKTSTSEVEGQTFQNEDRLLKQLSQIEGPEAALFPRALDCLELSGYYVLIRTYIPGQSLEAWVESEPARPGIDRKNAVRCVSAVLRQLQVLHHMQPPCIHRDIKPQNVIIDLQGQCHLIDMGIARVVREGDGADTQVMGTGMTAPPEQFGYRQTDERSDIYSVGVLLRYCLTERYDEGADASIDADLRRVVQKATAFDPSQRYRRVEDMLFALDHGLHRRNLRRRLTVAALLVLSVAAGAFLWAHSRSSGFVLTEDMFRNVPEIYACYTGHGIYPYSVRAYIHPDGLFFTDCDGDVTWSVIEWRRADINGQALEDRLNALRDSSIPISEIILQNLRFETLEPLGRPWPNEVRLIFDHCTLPSDWSALSGMGETLEGLHVSGEYDASDLSWMSSLTGLNWLALGGEGLDVESIARMDWLSGISLGEAGIEDLSVFTQMGNLTELSLPGNDIQDLSPLAGMTELQDLNIPNNQVEDLSPLTELPRLRLVDITGNRVTDFSPIERDGIEIIGRDAQQ